MHVVIPVAGKGTRLLPITQTVPKPLVEVAGKSILRRQIESYVAAGIPSKNVVLVSGYLVEHVRDFVAGSYPDVTIVHSPDYAKTSNMYSIMLGVEATKEDGEPVFISNGDCVYCPTIIRDLVNHEKEDLFAVDAGTFTEDSLKVCVDGDCVTGFDKAYSEEESYGNSLQIFKLGPSSVAKLKKIMRAYADRGELQAWSGKAFNELVKDVDIPLFEVGGRDWQEIDDSGDLGTAEETFAKNDAKQRAKQPV